MRGARNLSGLVRPGTTAASAGVFEEDAEEETRVRRRELSPGTGFLSGDTGMGNAKRPKSTLPRGLATILMSHQSQLHGRHTVSW
jgi:hypothetical protein